MILVDEFRQKYGRGVLDCLHEGLQHLEALSHSESSMILER